MSQSDPGAAVLADRTKSKQDASQAADPVRDESEPGSECRDLVVVNPKETPRKGKRSRYADALFLAHMFASKFDAPQQREKRRADPADANASYRKGSKRPVKTGRVLSKKV
jgi:hypothetical protein